MVPYTPAADRFWRFVSIPTDLHECWIWQGYIRPNGYGTITDQGRTLKAHRLSYELHHGPIPEGGYVLHSCDTPACVNPRHLRVGTQLDNLREAASKHRTSVRLTQNQVREIRERRAQGESGPSIARDFGVDHSTIYRIARGQIRNFT